MRLVSMMHIGEKSFYRASLLTAHAGCRHRSARGCERPRGSDPRPLLVSNVATLLGLTSQETSRSNAKLRRSTHPRPRTPRRSSFAAPMSIFPRSSPHHRLHQRHCGVLANPTLENTLRTLQAPDSPFHHPHADAIVQHDILDIATPTCSMRSTKPCARTISSSSPGARCTCRASRRISRLADSARRPRTDRPVVPGGARRKRPRNSGVPSRGKSC